MSSCKNTVKFWCCTPYTPPATCMLVSLWVIRRNIILCVSRDTVFKWLRPSLPICTLSLSPWGFEVHINTDEASITYSDWIRVCSSYTDIGGAQWLSHSCHAVLLTLLENAYIVKYRLNKELEFEVVNYCSHHSVNFFLMYFFFTFFFYKFPLFHRIQNNVETNSISNQITPNYKKCTSVPIIVT